MCKTKMTLYILWELRVYTNTNYENQEVQSYVLLSLSNAQYTYSTHGYSALVDGMNIRELNHVFFLTLFVLSFCIEVVVEQENFFFVLEANFKIIQFHLPDMDRDTFQEIRLLKAPSKLLQNTSRVSTASLATCSSTSAL